MCLTFYSIFKNGCSVSRDGHLFGPDLFFFYHIWQKLRLPDLSKFIYRDNFKYTANIIKSCSNTGNYTDSNIK